MTILEMDPVQARPVRVVGRDGRVAQQPAARRRPPARRPAGAPLQHRGSGVLVSRASHRRRPITPVTTVLLALVAAGITVWLGLIAQLGGVEGSQAGVPPQLAVVQVQAGETLHQVAQRVAPRAPVGDVVERIRELNRLDTAALDTGQTLIAPVG
ncbi:LysM peptidoglycan-binding domain-containing protein [Mycolicibacterium sp. S2-37]|uniref:LysM peptidoglycan-binding domain-containing protein n=1 Tax=Mycolicibacterium sp. S2-37 TaxID=2810297 RepID=UPI001A942423|nr:LysM peptidoglycan-binding domain-containing protein [Mycolicibacterium sp. S2-37]MBO0676999.1 LysM peptidoglycan-binding domain-containing protein [Mycolicibacterium sp. S2-37]